MIQVSGPNLSFTPVAYILNRTWTFPSWATWAPNVSLNPLSLPSFHSRCMEVSWPWPHSDREAMIYLYKIPRYIFMKSRWLWQLLNFWMLFFALATSLQKKSTFKTPGFFWTISLPSNTPSTPQGPPGHRSLGQADIHHRFQFKAKLLTEIFPGEPPRASDHWPFIGSKEVATCFSLLSFQLICIINEEGVVSKELHLHENSHPTSHLAIPSTRRCRISFKPCCYRGTVEFTRNSWPCTNLSTERCWHCCINDALAFSQPRNSLFFRACACGPSTLYGPKGSFPRRKKIGNFSLPRERFKEQGFVFWLASRLSHKRC